jgi:8-oxo-dGTP pyrophosphatase MutT (NUDIX family)
MTTDGLIAIGFIEDKTGKKYEVKLRTKKRNDTNRYYFNVFDGIEFVGMFEFDVYPYIYGEDYANIDDAAVESKYRSKGIYNSFLLFARDFFKKLGLKGIFSEGMHRNASSDGAWSKVKGATFIETPTDEMGYKYKNYTLEHLKSFQMFEKETKYTVYDNSKGGRFWGDSGAGILPICRSTGKILISFRSKEVNEPNTFGIFGGKIEKGETPLQAAERELVEETEYPGKYEIIPAYVFVAPGGDFQYHNFIGIVEHEFVPTFNWETDSATWMSLEELIAAKPKHFGLRKLLEKSMDIIKQFAK